MSRKKGTYDLLSVSATLLWERVPLGNACPQAKEETRKLAREFVANDSWAMALDGRLLPEDLGKLLDLLVPWVRSRGYELYDEVSEDCYSEWVSKARGPWLPQK